MSRVLPYPILSAFILGMWLLLQQSLGLGHIVMGIIIALLGGYAMGALKPEKAHIGKPLLIVRLFFIVSYDIIRSNLAVAWILLTSGRREPTSGFMEIPLELRHRTALATLAVILTSTPGTVWLDFDPVTGRLLIHVLDLVDEEEWVTLIKHRYERLLLEIVS